ncbi:two-component regulator propeller domain-containing protein [Lacibacter sp. H375]|uniref:ligand-binding sensor domain-containing protein n=1 Tax=Lacibacter sp. H375 TaxID=3133424 RepID=UPI0030C1DA65
MPHKLSFICIFFCFLNSAAAQETLNYTFTHYNTSSGLLSNQVNTVVQDEQGYIWTGSVDGLQRFDGIRYKTFRHRKNDSTTISSNPISQLLIDSSKNLWILMSDGRIGIFNTKNFRFSETPLHMLDKDALKTSIKKVVLDSKGDVFMILGGHELLVYDANKHAFVSAHKRFKIPDGWHIGDFAEQPNAGKYWFTTKDGTIAIYNNATKNLSTAYNNIEKEKIIDQYKGVIGPYGYFFDSKNRVWFLSWGNGFPYIYCYDLKKNDLYFPKAELHSYIKSYYEVHGFLEQKDGSIWIRGLQIFARFNETTKTFDFVNNGYTSERSIAYEHVRGLTEDRENNLWVATNNNGLYRFNPAEHVFQNVTHINRVTGLQGRGGVLSSIEMKDGTILVSAWGDGLYHYDKNLKPIPINIKGLDERLTYSIWSMYASQDSNTIWLSAQPGFVKINQQTRTSAYYNPPVLQNRTVRQIAEDKLGNLWFGMQSIGLFKWNASTGKKDYAEGIKHVSSLPTNQVNKIIVDSKGLVWIAFATDGIYAIDPSTDKVIYHFSNTKSGAYKLPQEGVSALLEYNDSTMIITTGSQILLFNRISNKTRLLGNAETISGYIASLEKDRNGYIWLSSTSGLYRISIQKNLFIRFGKTDGIDNEDFALSSSRRFRDGRLIFGSSNHFVVFDPVSIVLNNAKPKVTITDFKVRNKSIPVDSLLKLELINLSPGNNSVIIEFSNLQYNTSSVIQYKMDKIDKDWQSADNNNQAVYSFLPIGTHTFRLRVMDEEGRFTEQDTKLVIKMNPPFWKSWWFYSLLILAGGAIIFWLDRERMKRKEAMQEMRSGIADNLHKEVNTALSNINILSEMAKLKADKDPEKSKEYIEQIHTKSHNMMIAMDDMLWSIDPDNDNMTKTVERMKEYLDALNNRNGAEIDILVDKNVEALSLNMKLRHESFLLFKEAVKSLIYAGAQKCNIHISYEKPRLQFTMQFKNDCCDMQQLNNLLQRQDMENRLKTIKAQLDVQVHKSSSIFVLLVPVA